MRGIFRIGARDRFVRIYHSVMADLRVGTGEVLEAHRRRGAVLISRLAKCDASGA